MFGSNPFKIITYVVRNSEAELAAAVLDHQPAAEHAAEMREVRDAGGGLGDAEHELERGEAEDEHARGHRDRRGEEEHAAGGGGEGGSEEQGQEAAPGGGPRHPGRAPPPPDDEGGGRR